MAIFESSRLKIERANKHIQELSAVVGAFFQSDSYSMRIERNYEGMSALEFEFLRAFPTDIPLIIGDALHNLHTALDLAIYTAVRLGAGHPSRYVKFPFAKDGKSLVASLKNREIKTHCPRIYDLIINDIKPYSGGNDLLYALHDLDILDKHKLLIPVASVVGLHTVTGREGSILLVGTEKKTFAEVRQGAKVCVVSKAPLLEIAEYSKPTFDIFFNHGEVLKNQAIIPTLHNLSQLVSGIIDLFRDVYIVSDRSA